MVTKVHDRSGFPPTQYLIILETGILTGLFGTLHIHMSDEDETPKLPTLPPCFWYVYTV